MQYSRAMHPATRRFTFLAVVGTLLGAAAAAPVPAAVTDVRDRYDGCIHWGGEPSGDPQRAAQIAKAQRELKCDALKRDVLRLKRKYAKNPAALAALDDMDLTGF
jgi:hypothetical protein